jgi:hypothetical protein
MYNPSPEVYKRLDRGLGAACPLRASTAEETVNSDERPQQRTTLRIATPATLAAILGLFE